MSTISLFKKIDQAIPLNEENFERGQDPKRAMNLGLVDRLTNSTQDAYSAGRYGPVWEDVVKFLLDEGISPEGVEWILRSKHMRWAADGMEDKITLDGFKKYFNKGINKGWNGLNRDIEKEVWLKEDMGGTSAPISNLGNTPGMGNASPAGSATTGSMSNSNTGSGDKWDSSTGIKPAVQENLEEEDLDEENINPHDKLGVAMAKKMGVPVNFEKRGQGVKQKKVDEMNISPYDKLGVAMAKKMGAALPFVKGKGDKDVEQKVIDKDIDLSTKLMSFEEWEKQFLGEGVLDQEGDFSFQWPVLLNWKDPKGELVYIATNDSRYPYEHVFYNEDDDLVYFYSEEDKHSIAYPRDQVQKTNWALPWVQKYLKGNG